MNRRERRRHTKKRGDLNRRTQHSMRSSMGEGSKVETRMKIMEKLGIAKEENAHSRGSEGIHNG